MEEKEKIVLDGERPEGEGGRVEEEPLNTEATPTCAAGARDQIDVAVELINDTMKGSRDKGYDEIGIFLIEHFFGGDITQAFSKNPKKENSYRRLCEREDLAVDVSTLSRILRVAAQEKFLKESGIDTTGLSFTHKTELIKLKNDVVKIDYVRSIVENPPPSRELAQKIKEMKPGTQAVSHDFSLEIRRLKSFKKALDRPEIVELLTRREQAILVDEATRKIVEELKKSSSSLTACCDGFLAAGDEPLAG